MAYNKTLLAKKQVKRNTGATIVGALAPIGPSINKLSPQGGGRTYTGKEKKRVQKTKH